MMIYWLIAYLKSFFEREEIEDDQERNNEDESFDNDDQEQNQEDEIFDNDDCE